LIPLLARLGLQIARPDSSPKETGLRLFYLPGSLNWPLRASPLSVPHDVRVTTQKAVKRPQTDSYCVGFLHVIEYIKITLIMSTVIVVSCCTFHSLPMFLDRLGPQPLYLWRIVAELIVTALCDVGVIGMDLDDTTFHKSGLWQGNSIFARPPFLKISRPGWLTPLLRFAPRSRETLIGKGCE